MNLIMLNWPRILGIIFVLMLATSAQAVDTKYFSAFTYKQASILGSDYTFTPEFRFEHGAKELYYYHVRTGWLFHPSKWLDLGFYVGFNNEKNLSGNWDPDNFFEFVVDPKIIIDFSQIVEKAEARVGQNDFVKQANDATLRFLDVLSYAEFEVHDFDLNDLGKLNLVFQLRPELRWQRGVETYYLRDDIFYSFKFGEVYRNWTTLGWVHPYKDFTLDLYYIFESDRTIFLTPNWEFAHVFGTKLIWDRR